MLVDVWRAVAHSQAQLLARGNKAVCCEDRVAVCLHERAAVGRHCCCGDEAAQGLAHVVLGLDEDTLHEARLLVEPHHGVLAAVDGWREGADDVEVQHVSSAGSTALRALAHWLSACLEGEAVAARDVVVALVVVVAVLVCACDIVDALRGECLAHCGGRAVAQPAVPCVQRVHGHAFGARAVVGGSGDKVEGAVAMARELELSAVHKER